MDSTGEVLGEVVIVMMLINVAQAICILTPLLFIPRLK
jgi:hypothetical protein